jgi:hypothetical protein
VYFKYEKPKRPIVNFEENMHVAIQVRKLPEKKE